MILMRSVEDEFCDFNCRTRIHYFADVHSDFFLNMLCPGCETCRKILILILSQNIAVEMYCFASKFKMFFSTCFLPNLK